MGRKGGRTMVARLRSARQQLAMANTPLSQSLSQSRASEDADVELQRLKTAPPQMFADYFESAYDEQLFERLLQRGRQKSQGISPPSNVKRDGAADEEPKKGASYSEIPRFYFPKRKQSNTAVDEGDGTAQQPRIQRGSETHSAEIQSLLDHIAQAQTHGDAREDGDAATRTPGKGGQEDIREGGSSVKARKQRLGALLDDTARQFLHSSLHDSSVTNEDLQHVWAILSSNGRDTLTYDEFIDCSAQVADFTDKFRAFFHPLVYLSVCEDAYDTISLDRFFDLIMFIVNWKQRYIALTRHADAKGDLISLASLGDFLHSQLHAMPALAIPPAKVDTYIKHALKKFEFLHCMGKNKLRVKDVLLSESMGEFYSLRDQGPQQGSSVGLASSENWFSLDTFLNVRGEFLRLDSDNMNMLTSAQLMRFQSNALNPMIIERVFQERLTVGGRLDYEGYLELVLARWCLHTKKGISYFFRLLDVEQKGYLTHADIYQFFKGVQHHAHLRQFDFASFEDIRTEIIDLVRPRDLYRITLADLLACGKADYVILMLTDAAWVRVHENVGGEEDGDAADLEQGANAEESSRTGVDGDSGNSSLDGRSGQSFGGDDDDDEGETGENLLGHDDSDDGNDVDDDMGGIIHD